MICYDLAIKNARVVDGTGSPWFWGDVGVKDGKISYIGKLPENICAGEIIDAAGKVLSPGFIDCHAHSDFLLFKDSIMLSKIKQGVTTQMIGPCGISPAPIKPERVELLDKYAGFAKAGAEPEYNWQSFGEFLNVLNKMNLGTNIGAYVGHGTVRLNVMGFDARKPTEEEIVEMKQQVRDAMADGAFGMSTGLIYPPGVYSQPEEIVEVAKALKEFNGVYLSHMRSESFNILHSVRETIDVAEKAGIPGQIHHHKVCGKKHWGLVKETIQLLEEARQRGVDMTIDQYPYTSGSTTLRSMLPPWVHEGGIEKVIERLESPSIRAKIIDEIKNTDNWDNPIYLCDGPQGIMLIYTPATPQYEGKNLAEISEMTGRDPLESAMDIIIANRGLDTACYFFACEDDVKYVMKNPITMIGSDSIPAAPGAKCHPRTCGTFPRILGKYVREEKTLILEEAIKKMTGFPASRFNIPYKGLIKLGMDADLVIFNPDTIIDGADYDDPYKEADGIDYVFINGQTVLINGEFTGKTPGKVIRRGF